MSERSVPIVVVLGSCRVKAVRSVSLFSWAFELARMTYLRLTVW